MTTAPPATATTFTPPVPSDFIPERFRAAPKWSERFALPLFKLARPGARMKGAEYADLAAGLMRRDELAAQLVEAMREQRTVTMAQVRTALNEGLEAVANPPEPLLNFFTAVQQRPQWVDDELLERGAAACRRIGRDGFDILAYGSLLGGYRSGGALQPLVRTGRIAEETLHRVGETGDWWLACTAPGGLQQGAEGWRLSVHVRIMHGFVNYQLERDPDWDWQFRGRPINAHDQAGTIGAFSTSYLIQARSLGIRISAPDAAAIMHLWSYVGWLMGVEEQWLPRTEKVGRRVLANIVASFSPPESSSHKLGEGVIGMHDLAPGISSWRRWFERERALSMATWLNLGYGMADIGQPMRPPWYPALRVISNLVWTHGIGRLPGGKTVLAARANHHLKRLNALQFGGARPNIAAIDAARKVAQQHRRASSVS